jgi:hypothetical protein
MTDRDDLLDRTADTLRDSFDRAIATPGGRAAYDHLTRHGGTLTLNGREIAPETGEVRRERRNPPDPATRDARLEGYIGPGDPDDLWPPVKYYGGVQTGKRTVVMPFGESRDLADLGAALIDRDRMLRAIDTWEIRVAYLWGDDLGKVAGEPRLWRLKKADPLNTTLLGMCSPPRVVDVFCFVNARICSYAELTRWQMQAALHESLGCVRVRHGAVSVESLSGFWQAHVMRRYGIWRPDIKALQEVMRQAEEGQLALWDDEGDDE